jgi:hypothetical protein
MKYAFDPAYSRMIDILPVLSLQGLVRPHLEIGYGEFSTSIEKSKPDEIETEFGTLRVDRVDKRKINFYFGDPDPTNPPEILLKPVEITTDISNALGGLPELQKGIEDIVIKEMGVIEPIPRGIPREGPLEEVDRLYLHQTARGNFNKKIGQVTGIHLANPYHMAAIGLMNNHNMKPAMPLVKRMRSIEETTWIGGFRENVLIGYQEMGRALVELLQRSLAINRWWQDLATLHQFQFPIDHRVMDGHLYCLVKEGGFIPL